MISVTKSIPLTIVRVSKIEWVPSLITIVYLPYSLLNHDRYFFLDALQDRTAAVKLHAADLLV